MKRSYKREDYYQQRRRTIERRRSPRAIGNYPDLRLNDQVLMCLPLSNPLCYRILNAVMELGGDVDKAIYTVQALRECGVNTIAQYERISALTSCAVMRKLKYFLNN